MTLGDRRVCTAESDAPLRCAVILKCNAISPPQYLMNLIACVCSMLFRCKIKNFIFLNLTKSLQRFQGKLRSKNKKASWLLKKEKVIPAI
jgi:hypothetical protein